MKHCADEKEILNAQITRFHKEVLQEETLITLINNGDFYFFNIFVHIISSNGNSRCANGFEKENENSCDFAI